MSSFFATRRRVSAPTPTIEVERILSLPRRAWTQAQVEELVELLSEELRLRGSSATLRPLQAIALAEAYAARGLFGGMGVGTGKTLVSFLAPVLLGAERPLLFVPAALLEKTAFDLGHWEREMRVHPRMRVMSYEILQHPQHADDLDLEAPDLVICDEAHRLKNAKAARTKRVMRYLRQHPDCTFLALSGSFTSASVRDYAHLLTRALGAGAPVPRHWNEIDRWSKALDADVPEWDRPAPGVLLSISPAAEQDPVDELAQARCRYARRLRDTMGVVISSGAKLPAKLVLGREDIGTPLAIAEALDELKSSWCTPNGDELRYAIELWRYSRQLSLGFWGRWDPPPPSEWMDARGAWARFVRQELARPGTRCDSPARVALAFPHEPSLVAWRAVRDIYRPEEHTVIEWVSEEIAEHCVAWLRAPGASSGVCWCEHVAFGEKVAALAEVPYYGGGPESAREILHARGPFVTSIQARSEGINLQDRYSRNLIASAPASAKTWEQLLGRTHREGQRAPEVEVDLLLHTEALASSLMTALDRSRYIAGTIGVEQRLLGARFNFSFSSLPGVVLGSEEEDEEE
jgi:hypothetical protein